MNKINLRSEKPKTTEYTSRPLGPVVLLVGIVDDYGLDQLNHYDNLSNKEISLHWVPMGMRCRMNTHRNARRFTAMIKKKFCPEFPLDLRSNESAMSWYKTLKSIAIKWVEDGDDDDN